jgi:hypothetical protein
VDGWQGEDKGAIDQSKSNGRQAAWTSSMVSPARPFHSEDVFIRFERHA